MAGETAAEIAVKAWQDRLILFEASEHWGQWHDRAQLRSLVVALHAVISDTPGNLFQAFNKFDEGKLRADSRILMGNIPGRSPIVQADTAEDVLYRAAVLLRALDLLLIEGDETLTDEAPDCWLDATGQMYAIPLDRTVISEGGPKTGQTFIRRGILRHRLIPVSLGGIEICITLHPDVTIPASKPKRRVGAALFAGFELDYDELQEATFIVTQVRCDGGVEASIAKHCESARREHCDIWIWPELTIHPDEAGRIAAALQVDPLMTNLPPIVVAGSWHVRDGVKYRNISTVYDGRGDFLLAFEKNRKFTFKGLTERIVPSDRLDLLVTDHELIALAICKDFCDLGKPEPPVGLINVDFVLVPSMGGDRTMTSHRDAANRIAVDFGTRTAIVQQKYPVADKDAVGFVLRMPAEPCALELGDLVERRQFTTFQPEVKPVRSPAQKA